VVGLPPEHHHCNQLTYLKAHSDFMSNYDLKAFNTSVRLIIKVRIQNGIST
jgi:hypothetical protein